jgi:hypothetical protein
LTITETVESLRAYVVAFPEEERRDALIRLIDLWEEVHIHHNTPMPLFLHLMRHDFAWSAAYKEDETDVLDVHCRSAA